MKGGLDNPRPVDDTPVNGQVEEGISSNWAFDHAADLEAHTKNIRELIRTGNYYFPHPGAYTNKAPVANYLYAQPFFVARDITVDRIAVHVNTLKDPSNVRLGIYNNGTNLYPGTLVVDAGTISGATTGIKAIVINEALTKGLYWLVLVADDTPTLKGHHYGYCIYPGIGVNVASFDNFYMGWTKPFAYAALPDPFTAGGTQNADYFPKILCRVASLD